MATTNDINALPPPVQAGGGRQRKEVLPSVVLAVCLAAFLVKAMTSIIQESATWDETSCFGLGKYILQTHRRDVPGAILHPPLSYVIHGIPLLFFSTDQSVWTDYPDQNGIVNSLPYPTISGDRRCSPVRQIGGSPVVSIAPHDGVDRDVAGLVCVFMELLALWKVERHSGNHIIFVQPQYFGPCAFNHTRYHPDHLLVYNRVLFLEAFAEQPEERCGLGRRLLGAGPGFPNSPACCCFRF